MIIKKTEIDDNYDKQYDEHEDIMSYIAKSYINYYNIEIFDKNTQKEKEKEDNIKKYDYKKAVTDDICNYVLPEIGIDEYKDKMSDINDLICYVEGTVKDDSRVVGNMYKSYVDNKYEAEEYLCHNLDLLEEALIGYNVELDYLLENDAPFCDRIIRENMFHYAIEDIFKDKTLEEGISLIKELKNKKNNKEKENMNVKW